MKEKINYLNLLDINLLQKIQDYFAEITGIGSLIYDIKGNPITKPSNFCEYCSLIRSTRKGAEKCRESDAMLWEMAKKKKEGGAILCKSGRLWDGVAPIIVDGQHIASWGIGQFLFEEPDEQFIVNYAREIGIDEKTLLQASRKVKRVTRKRIEKIIQFLMVLSNEISEMALYNLRLRKEIACRKKSEERYSAIVKNAIVGICEISKSGELEYVNEQFAKMLGYSIDELLNKNFFTLFQSKYNFKRFLSKMVDYANPKYATIGYDVKDHIRRKNGEFIPCRICLTPQRSLSGDIIKLSAVIIDISSEEEALKRLELQNQKVVEKQKQITMFFDNSLTAMCIYDKNLKIIRWNPAYQKFIHDNFKKDVDDIVDINEPIDKKILKNIFSGDIKSYEIKREFGFRIFSFKVTPILDYENRIHQALVSIDDVTDYQLMVEKALFSERMAGIGLLASGIAHDIKGIFTVLGNCNYTLRKLDPAGSSKYFKEQYKKIISTQEEGLKFAENLLNKLFILSSKKHSFVEYFNVKQGIESIISIYNGEILRKNALVTVICDENLVIKCDKYLFNQLFMNLLANAIDAVNNNGKIDIEISTDERILTILFSDNGRGIKYENLQKIFKAFYTDKKNGTGLGLFSVKNIVESLKGNITIKSEVGKGTTFIMKFEQNENISFKNDRR